MSLRTHAKECGVAAALALALTLAAPALAAAEAPGADAANNMPLHVAPPIPPAPPLPTVSDWRPAWWNPSYTAIVLPDSRTRGDWLRECHRRMTPSYDYGDDYRPYRDRRDRGGRRHGRDRGHGESYAQGKDNCEAYFDDYYRYQAEYAQRAYAHSYQTQTTSYQGGQRQVEEVVTERYEPIRSRIIERRPVIRDKRIRVAP
jgi:hypothetical protein